LVEGRRPDGSFGVLWLTPHATEMTEQDWNFPEGASCPTSSDRSQQTDAPLYIVLNAAPQAIEFMLPALAEYSRWTLCLQTAREPRLGGELAAGSKAHAPPRSILVFSGSP
jgi:glycogen operon protein